METRLRGLLSSGGAVFLELLRGALLGGSVRTSRQITYVIFSDTRNCFRNEATTYVGGSKTLIVGSQEQFTSGHERLGIRPRPANTK